MCVILYTSYILISTSRRWDGVHEAIARREKPVGVRLSQCSWKWSRSRFSEMTFSPPHTPEMLPACITPPVVPRKHLYVRKAGYSRYRVRRFFPPRLFPFCDKGIVGSECACRVFSTGECRVVPRVQRPDPWIRAFFVSHKKTKIPRNPIPTHSFLHYYI